jgi:hypothetical protein
VHGTTRVVPRERFEQEERAVLQALASHPYHSLTLRASATREHRSTRSTSASGRSPAPSQTRSLPRIDVEQRPLRAYAALAGGAR